MCHQNISSSNLHNFHRMELDHNGSIEFSLILRFRRNFTLGCTPKPFKLYIKFHQMMPCIHINHKKWYSTYQFVVYPIFSLKLPSALARLSYDPSIPINWVFHRDFY